MTDQQRMATITPDRLVVSGRPGAKMHLAKVRPAPFATSDADADTLCGRRLYAIHAWPLDEEQVLPWDLCSPCAARRAKNGSSTPTPGGEA